MAALTNDIAAFAAQYGVELDFAATMDVTEALNLVFLPREFQPVGGSFWARSSPITPSSTAPALRRSATERGRWR